MGLGRVTALRSQAVRRLVNGGIKKGPQGASAKKSRTAVASKALDPTGAG